MGHFFPDSALFHWNKHGDIWKDLRRKNCSTINLFHGAQLVGVLLKTHVVRKTFYKHVGIVLFVF